MKVTAPSTNVPLGVLSLTYEAKAACGVTVTVTVALEAAGTVTDSDEKVRSIPRPVQLVEWPVKSVLWTSSDRAWPPSV